MYPLVNVTILHSCSQSSTTSQTNSEKVAFAQVSDAGSFFGYYALVVVNVVAGARLDSGDCACYLL